MVLENTTLDVGELASTYPPRAELLVKSGDGENDTFAASCDGDADTVGADLVVQRGAPVLESNCHFGLSSSPLVSGDPCIAEQKLPSVFAAKSCETPTASDTNSSSGPGAQDFEEEFVIFGYCDFVRLTGLATVDMNGRFSIVRGALQSNGRIAVLLHGDVAAKVFLHEKLMKYAPLDDDLCLLCAGEANMFAFPPCECGVERAAINL